MITVSDTGFIEVREKEQDLVLNLEKGKIYNYEGEGYNISKGVYAGGMSTIGIQLAF